MQPACAPGSESPRFALVKRCLKSGLRLSLPVSTFVTLLALPLSFLRSALLFSLARKNERTNVEAQERLPKQAPEKAMRFESLVMTERVVFRDVTPFFEVANLVESGDEELLEARLYVGGATHAQGASHWCAFGHVVWRSLGW